MSRSRDIADFVAEITDGTDTVQTGYVINTAGKLWINFNGTGTVVIRDSFNASSLSDIGTGDYGVSLSASMADTNYSWNIGGWNNSNGNGSWNAAGTTGGASYPSGVETGALKLRAFTSSGSNQDQHAYCVSIMGDLA